MERLKAFFDEHRRIAVAFSGGTDSAFLLYAAGYYKADVKAYYMKTAFQPQFELDDAVRLCRETGTELEVLDEDILSDEIIRQNPPNRCYYCKKRIFTALTERAYKDGYTVMADGTNASDDISDRPGFRALAELRVLSPLRECGLTKAEIRRLSAEAGLFTAYKPSYACLATRIPSGTEIRKEDLEKTERAEAFLSSLGMSGFRVRLRNGKALIEARKEDLKLAVEKRDEIVSELGRSYEGVYLNLEARNE